MGGLVPLHPFSSSSKRYCFDSQSEERADIKHMDHSLPLMELITGAPLESLVSKCGYYPPPLSCLQTPALVGGGTETDINLAEFSFCSKFLLLSRQLISRAILIIHLLGDLD